MMRVALVLLGLVILPNVAATGLSVVVKDCSLPTDVIAVKATTWPVAWQQGEDLSFTINAVAKEQVDAGFMCTKVVKTPTSRIIETIKLCDLVATCPVAAGADCQAVLSLPAGQTAPGAYTLALTCNTATGGTALCVSIRATIATTEMFQ